MALMVGEVAKRTKLSVRTLHHYDELGLLRPSGRSEAGYRLYTQADLVRLQQVLFFRELGFSLADIKSHLDDPDFDLRSALRFQRELLAERAARAASLLQAVDTALESLDKGTQMDTRTMFDGFDPSQYEEEARERWGHTEAYQESQKRAARYTTADWERFKAENDRVYRGLAEKMTAGRPPDAEDVLALVEEHRGLIDRWFYPCPVEMHRNLGQLYVDDVRFTQNIDTYGKGLSAYLRDAFAANAERKRS